MNPKLNDLPPEEQEEIINQRIAATQLIRNYAHTTMDPISLASCELDQEARRMGVHVEFSEELDEMDL